MQNFHGDNHHKNTFKGNPDPDAKSMSQHSGGAEKLKTKWRAKTPKDINHETNSPKGGIPRKIPTGKINTKSPAMVTRTDMPKQCPNTQEYLKS